MYVVGSAKSRSKIVRAYNIRRGLLYALKTARVPQYLKGSTFTVEQRTRVARMYAGNGLDTYIINEIILTFVDGVTPIVSPAVYYRKTYFILSNV